MLIMHNFPNRFVTFLINWRQNITASSNVSQIDVFLMVCVPGIPAVLNPHCPESPLTTVRNANQNFMYQWVFKTMWIPGTEERNIHQTSVHADQITSFYSLSCACGKIYKLLIQLKMSTSIQLSTTFLGYLKLEMSNFSWIYALDIGI